MPMLALPCSPITLLLVEAVYLFGLPWVIVSISSSSQLLVSFWKTWDPTCVYASLHQACASPKALGSDQWHGLAATTHFDNLSIFYHPCLQTRMLFWTSTHFNRFIWTLPSYRESEWAKLFKVPRPMARRTLLASWPSKVLSDLLSIFEGHQVNDWKPIPIPYKHARTISQHVILKLKQWSWENQSQWQATSCN